MLEAVLHNWTAMGKASTDLFAKRIFTKAGQTHSYGKTIQRSFWRKKHRDILLDKLPWNLGLCKLPWRDKIIFTDW